MSYDLTIKKKTFNHDAIENIALRDEKELSGSLNDSKNMPWHDARLGSNKYINVLLPEEYCMKLDYLSKKRRITKSKICSEAVIAEIDRMLEE